MFKNLLVFCIQPGWEATLPLLESVAMQAVFAPCAPTQLKSVGWVAPVSGYGDDGLEAGLVQQLGQHFFMTLAVEQRKVPAAAINQRVDEIVSHIEQTTGRKPGRGEVKELKEQALHELLPRAFASRSHVRIWFDMGRRLLLIDTGSMARADEVTSMLVKAMDGFSLALLQTRSSPSGAMGAWLLEGETPEPFTLDRECELRSTDEMKSAVRYTRHTLDLEEIRQHLHQGKEATQLSMTWQDRVGLVFTDKLQLRKIELLDVVFDGVEAMGAKEDPLVQFQADMTIMTAELGGMLDDLVRVMGGEL